MHFWTESSLELKFEPFWKIMLFCGVGQKRSFEKKAKKSGLPQSEDMRRVMTFKENATAFSHM